MLSFLLAILIFGIIILIHEFGHFFFAKLNKIEVIEFSIGMGPRLFSFHARGTKYSLKILPFGGSCMMAGEDEDENDPNPHAFNNCSVLGRISVIAAGPVFNFILAFVFALIIMGCVGYDSPDLKGVTKGYPAEEAGLQAGDVITKLNQQKIVFYRDIKLYLYLHPGETLNVEYDRNLSDGKTEHKSTVIVPKYSEEYNAYMMGVELDPYMTKINSVSGVIKYSVQEVRYWVETAVKSVGMLVRGKVKSNEIAGPVRMVYQIDQTVETSRQYGAMEVFLQLSNMIVLLSANLGVMNLLPIPALDGGRLFFLIIELLRRKPISRKIEARVHMAGMVFLLGLMIFVLLNDICSFF